MHRDPVNSTLDKEEEAVLGSLIPASIDNRKTQWICGFGNKSNLCSSKK